MLVDVILPLLIVCSILIVVVAIIKGIKEEINENKNRR